MMIIKQIDALKISSCMNIFCSSSIHSHLDLYLINAMTFFEMEKTSNQVFIVDDEPDYTYLMEEALKRCKPSPATQVFHSGTDLLKWLEVGYQPSLIFLDINMPGLTGFDILKILKANKKYETIPVVVLTALEDKEDIIKSYKMGANAHMSKVLVTKELIGQIEMFNSYWSSNTPSSNTSRFKLDDYRDN